VQRTRDDNVAEAKHRKRGAVGLLDETQPQLLDSSSSARIDVNSSGVEERRQRVHGKRVVGVMRGNRVARKEKLNWGV
jgi:hypothetical protein